MLEAQAWTKANLNAIRRTLKALPRSAHWEVDGPVIDFTFDFSFQRAPECDLVVGPAPDGWRRLLAFGVMTVAQGGGATPLVTVDERSGSVVGLDVERDDECTSLMGSTPQQFVEVFSLLHGFFGVGKSVPQAVLDEIRAIDEAAMGEWVGIIEYVNGEHLI